MQHPAEVADAGTGEAVTSINSKMGLRPAGKRSMMKLPTSRAEAAKLTAAQCPACQQRGAQISRVQGREGWYTCSWCAHSWDPDAEATHAG